ncbi:MAG TPA: RDD family protein [Agriterribacter sp.]|nr:RDD family protein [Agriterribacter sp.]
MTPTTQYPMLIDRIQSAFIDVVLVITIMFAAGSLLDNIQDPPDWIRIGLFVGLWAMYEPLCISLGCTVGQYVKGLRVRSYHNPENRIDFARSLVRYVAKSFLGWISFVTINTNPEKRAIHDFAAASIMIKHKAG